MKLHDAYARGGAILATAGLLFGSAPAWADEPDPALTADTVKVSASRVDKELLDVPMSVSVITREQIERSPARTVGELLQDVPGVQINNSGGQGMKRVSIRGEIGRAHV